MLLLTERQWSAFRAFETGKLDREGRYNGKTKRDEAKRGISNWIESYRVARTKSQWTIVGGGETILPTVGIYVVRHASNRYTINGISCVGNAPNGSSLFNALSGVYIYIYRNRSTPLSLRGRKRAERNFSLSREPSRVESCKSARRRFH